MSTSPVSNTSPKKDLYSLISSGILLIDRKLWFSINADGVKNEMISARKFSYKNVKWRSIRKTRFCQIYILALPRFSKVAKISDISNLMIQDELKPQLLTPGIMYGAYLVFKFCSRRKISSLPLYVNLRYKKDGETLNAYFAEWSVGI
ncbi:probable serine/threonine-protein kinase PBL28 [Tanacetum coccineum]|uniref:Probable serine/threonine-protein kinase PBL28 n=1 Tax=Tanacetum coccineum TaxID=301880 RepID=A0ABQ5DL94_9ASTR